MVKKKYGILLDTETVSKHGETLIYDLAWLVIDNNGNVIEEHNFIIDEVYSDFPTLFDSQFITYGKYQWYSDALAHGMLESVPAFEALNALYLSMCEYNVSFVTAYNVPFDLRAINETCKHLRISNPLESYERVTGNELAIMDLWRLAKNHIVTKPYEQFCVDNGFLTDRHKKPKTSAEIVYRWISDNVDFTEDHTALSDCLIEVEIYVKCKRKKKRIPESVFVSRS